MDAELLREYRTLHDLQKAPEDTEKVIDYLSMRLELRGMRVQLAGSTVNAVWESAEPGAELTLGCAYEAQNVHDGTMEQVYGNDGLCAMFLTAVNRIAKRYGRITKGKLTFCFRNGAETEKSSDCVEFRLSDQRLGHIAVCGSGSAAALCGDAVAEAMGKVGAQESGSLGIALGASPTVPLGTPGMDFKKAALEYGADILEKLIQRNLCE